ncbi:MAG: hypothetical protein WD397_07085 [Wenzhouxiangellaceae bacterium]
MSEKRRQFLKTTGSTGGVSQSFCISALQGCAYPIDLRIGVHVRPEWVFTLERNMQPNSRRAEGLGRTSVTQETKVAGFLTLISPEKSGFKG